LPGKYWFIVRRLALLPIIAFVSVSLIFFITQVMPGDPALLIAGPEASLEEVEAVRKELGLDAPAHVRYIDWLMNLLKGDLGRSYRSGKPVSELIATSLPKTLTLAICGMSLALIIAIPLGVITALRRDSLLDLSFSALSFLGVSIPRFWFGMMLILVFSVWLGILPSGGFISPLEDVLAGIKHLIMPSITLAVPIIAVITRLTRSSILEVMLEDYITAARAKGLPERVVIYRHALKNAMIPVVTMVGLSFGGLLGGTIIGETIFSIMGMGRLMYTGITSRDYNIIQGCAIVTIMVYIFVNLIVDILYMYLDPRVRYK